MEEGDFQEDLSILGNDKKVIDLGKEKQDSHPTKQKVKAFKNKVFSLLMLFVEKAKNVSPLVDVLTQDIIMQQPQKMREILHGLLNRGIIQDQKLRQIAEYFKNLLLFKIKKQSQKFGQDFVNILRKLRQQSDSYAKAMIQQMLQIYLTKRKCKLHQGFFHFILKKLPQMKQAIIEKCLSIEENIKLRPAQARVLNKLKQTLLKKQIIKVQNQEDGEEKVQ